MDDKNRKDLRLESMEQYGFGPKAMKKFKKCESCGAMAPASEQFCRECGTHLPDDTLFEFYKNRHRCCPVCETVLPENTQYCPKCGAKLELKEEH